MATGDAIELGGYPQTIAGSPDTAFEDGLHVENLSHLAEVVLASLEAERHGPRRDFEALDLR